MSWPVAEAPFVPWGFGCQGVARGHPGGGGSPLGWKHVLCCLWLPVASDRLGSGACRTSLEGVEVSAPRLGISHVSSSACNLLTCGVAVMNHSCSWRSQLGVFLDTRFSLFFPLTAFKPLTSAFFNFFFFLLMRVGFFLVFFLLLNSED